MSKDLSFKNKEEDPISLVGSNHYRTYFLDTTVCKTIYHTFIVDELESSIKEVAQKLFDSQMIDNIIFKRSSISIRKKSEYEWEDIDNLLKSALKEFSDFSIELILFEERN